MDEFVAAAEKVSTLPGKYGYCLRGGPGGLNGWVMFGATMAGSNTFFNEDGTSTLNSEGWVKGLDLARRPLQERLAPKDSVNWGFNEIVAGFYSGTCAMLDQDPDALIAIAERMKPEDYGVTPMPKGPDGKAFPTIGYAGWSMFAASENKDLSWKLIATLEGPEGNVEWNKRTGALPVHKSAENDPFYAERAVQGLVRGARPTRTWCRRSCRPTSRSSPSSRIRMVDQDQPAGAARRHHARGAGQAVGRLPDQGAAEVPGQEIAADREPAELRPSPGRGSR